MEAILINRRESVSYYNVKLYLKGSARISK